MTATAASEPPATTRDRGGQETDRPREWPKLIPQHQVFGEGGYTGLSRAGWFRLRAAGAAPNPVALPSGGIYFRRADLDKWIASLKPAR